MTQINKKIKEKILEKKICDSKCRIDLLNSSLKKIKQANVCKYKTNDWHIHIVDFNQETEWLKKMLKYMDKFNINKAVIFGLPVAKMYDSSMKSQPKYYLEDDSPAYYFHHTDTIVANEYNSLNKKEKKRFLPLVCGFNPMDINAAKHIKATFKNNPWVFCWIWEVLYRHDDLTLMTYGDPPRMNTRATYEIFKLAATYDLPICFHNNITSTWQSDYPKFLSEMEEALRTFPRVKAIFSHCWYSRRVLAPYYTDMIRRLLDTYENLYIDYSWIFFDDVLCKNEESIKQWVDLTEDYPTRITFGSDLLWTWLYKIWLVNSRYNDFLSRLSPYARQRLCIDNVEEIYWWNKNKIEEDRKVEFPKLSEFK